MSELEDLKAQVVAKEALLTKAQQTLETVANEYGMAFHTSLRKCGDTEAESKLWDMIKALPNDIWAAHLNTANDWLGITTLIEELKARS